MLKVKYPTDYLKVVNQQEPLEEKKQYKKQVARKKPGLQRIKRSDNGVNLRKNSRDCM